MLANNLRKGSIRCSLQSDRYQDQESCSDQKDPFGDGKRRISKHIYPLDFPPARNSAQTCRSVSYFLVQTKRRGDRKQTALSCFRVPGKRPQTVHRFCRRQTYGPHQNKEVPFRNACGNSRLPHEEDYTSGSETSQHPP